MISKDIRKRQPFLIIVVTLLVILAILQYLGSSDCSNLQLFKQQATTLNGGLELRNTSNVSELDDYLPNVDGLESKSSREFLISLETKWNYKPIIKETLKNRIECDDKRSTPFYSQRGPYWVLYNYIQAEKEFSCSESITYATHCDFTYLDNLFPLLERWKGPLSLSIYSPGSDFNETVYRIFYLRECTSPLIKQLVTFHIFFDNANIPDVTQVEDLKSLKFNCESSTKPKFGEDLPTYRKLKKLSYPVNVARNIAREMATTHYILTSDIELYPNPNLIQDFLRMVNSVDFDNENKLKVFPLSIFELEDNVKILPEDKMELVKMLENKSAIPFHKFVCSTCHKSPNANKWRTPPFDKEMKVIGVQKRLQTFTSWEPIYIGTKFQPLYDERLSWEGRSDKMTQGFVMCILDYEFHILNNGFLVHKPGIKRKQPPYTKTVGIQGNLIHSVIVPEITKIYGNREGCKVH